MAFTGILGSSDSKLGNIVMGLGAEGPEICVDNLSLTQDASMTKFPVGVGTNALSLTQVAACVRVQGNKKTATVEITITQSVDLLVSKRYPVTHNLVLTHLARNLQPISVSASNTLSLTDSSDANTFFNDVVHTLALSDEVILQRLPNFVVDDLLELTDFAKLQSRRVDAGNVLDLFDEAIVTGPKYLVASDAIQVIESVFDPLTFTFSNQITSGLHDLATVKANVTHRASNVISLADHSNGYVLSADAIDLSATSTLTLTQSARVSTVLTASNVLTLSDLASLSVGTPLKQVLNLLDHVTLNIARAGVSLTDSLAIHDAVRFILERGCMRSVFAPMIGSSSDPDAITPSSTMPAASMTTGFRLRYPAVSHTDEVVISRNPEFGNIDRFTMQKIVRETRGGTLLVYADPIWPKYTTLVMSFSSLSKSQGQALLQFLQDHIGQEIGLIDWENRGWKGVITNPTDPLVQDTRTSYTANLEFQGERV